MMKRIVSVLLVLMLLTGLCACGEQPKETVKTDDTDTTAKTTVPSNDEDDDRTETPTQTTGEFRLVDEDGNEWNMTDDVQTVVAMFQYNDATGANDPIVNLTFTAEGAQKFAQATRMNIDRTLSIYVGDELVSTPTVNAEITDGNVVITVESYEEAQRVANAIQSSLI